MQADSLTYYSFSHAAADDAPGSFGRRTLQPAVFLEAIDLADEMAGF